MRNVDEEVFQDTHVDWIGVDRGTLELIKHNITPVEAVGDFDSVNEQEIAEIRQKININPVKKEKDDTDLALAVDMAVSLNYKEICIYGATGGRLDHFMGAVQILTKPEFLDLNISISLVDQQNVITVLKPGKHKVDKIEHMNYVSFIPLNPNLRMKLDGFKYELPYTTLEQGSTLTISNEFKDDVEQPVATVELGNILMIQSKDK